MTAKLKKNSKKKKNYIERQLLISDPSKSRFGWLVGWMVGWCDKEGVGEGVQISKTSSDFQFPICSLV